MFVVPWRSAAAYSSGSRNARTELEASSADAECHMKGRARNGGAQLMIEEGCIPKSESALVEGELLAMATRADMWSSS